MADDFADEILRECGCKFLTRIDYMDACRAITLTRVRTKREDALMLCPDCDKPVDTFCERLVHWFDKSRLEYITCKAPAIRAEVERLERQMREDGK